MEAGREQQGIKQTQRGVAFPSSFPLSGDLRPWHPGTHFLPQSCRRSHCTQQPRLALSHGTVPGRPFPASALWKALYPGTLPSLTAAGQTDLAAAAR